MKVHILDDWFDTLRTLPSFARLQGHEVTVWTDHTEDIDTLARRLQEAEALVLFRERTPVTAALLDRLPGLKLISQRSVYPHVDVPACTANGVLLCSNMHSDTPSVAASELTFALMLASARQIPQQMASLRAGHWQMGVGQTLAGRRLGLYGYGRIAKQVAVYAQAFGMKVWWWGSDEGRARARADGVELAPDRARFFADSDFVSLHVRLKPATRGIITAEDLLSMKPSASFINTSRSGLVAPGALDKALEAGRPGRLALDVFDTEPLTDSKDPLVNHPSVIATPHIGYVTEDELDMQFADIYDQINAYAEGAPIHMINPEARGGQ
ncbi:D-3-phosphoglycerate dehydrogenase [Mameliella alba]|uniref:D-2-hydroxyacid dehydrogenase family protein n=1 Tax=Mameliella alba TaxID=561184 RepID=UPI0008911DE7|nr:D-2-hydroxyacid dehydrogenase family protein [Mameliella alba]OWV41200.1 3-phosphoglycerate dehydrogenase [Mameliella alba]PTR34638.1 D-3-phosphoglycerate dehydrogenase [Mameliella alba]GGF84186.1 D-3-phosphoglycerate dehydrogenase [Mameliella alba]SDE24852.1 D-3-phosphoglycerate dehydrogenase [Mameliella alba]